MRALIAIAHKILIAAYSIIKTRTPYRELGGNYLDQLHLTQRRDGLVRALEALGLNVVISPREPTET